MIVLKSYATWVVLGVIALVALLYQGVGEAVFIEILRIAVFATAINMLIAYSSAALRCFRTPGWPRAEQWGALAMVVLATGMAATSVVSLFYRLSGEQDWILRLPPVNAWALGMVWFGITFLTAPGFMGPKLRPSSRAWIATLWITTVIVALFVGIARPDLAEFAERIRPHLDRGFDDPTGP